jgi:DNA polymerase III alpha subunit
MGEERSVSPALGTDGIQGVTPVNVPPPEADIPVKKEREKQTRVKYLGLLTGIRKIQTKTGKLMAVGQCEGIDFKFSVVVFPKDYDILSPLLVEDSVLLVEGFLKCNSENGEISVVASTIKSHSISTLRKQAQEMDLFDSSHRVRGKLNRIAALGTNEAQMKPFLLPIPSGASKQDLIDLKSFLMSKPGLTSIHIEISGKRIDTKLSVSDPHHVVEWAKKRWTGFVPREKEVS